MKKHDEQNCNTCFLNLVPLEVVRIVGNYFLQKEEQDRKIFYFPHDWRNFMNTKKKYFGKWKKESQLIVLRYPLVERFYDSFEIQQQILQYIENPREQLELCFNYKYSGYSIPLIYSGKKLVDLQRITTVKRVRISNAEVSNFPFNVDRLEFFYCSFENHFQSFTNYSKVRNFLFQDDDSEETFDLTTLAHLESGIFSIKHCVNYHCLSNLKSLAISNCNSITDVSCFRNIPKLTLSHCPRITDVSSLGSCYDLDLSCNEGITDISALGNVHILHLQSCIHIADGMSHLKNVHTLDLGGCFQVTDISGLQSVVILDISGCDGIADISKLINLQELTIRGCKKIHDLSGLTNLQKLSINRKVKFFPSSLPVISCLSELILRENLFIIEDHPHSNSSMQVESPPTTKNIHYLDQIPTLTFYNCSFLVEFRSFPYLRSLTIVRCDNFTSLPLLPVLGYLELSSCDSLENLVLLGADLKFPIYELKIHDCESLTEIIFHRKVFQCRITECDSLQTLSVLNLMDSLRISGCMKLQKIINRSQIVCVDVSDFYRDYYNEGSNIEFQNVSNMEDVGEDEVEINND
jgi:hypothetical protein